MQWCIIVAALWLSLAAASEGYSSSRRAGFWLRWLLLRKTGSSRAVGFSRCGTWVQQLQFPGSAARAQRLWHTDFVAPWHVGSSQTSNPARVSCIARRILKPNWTTREASWLFFKTRYFLHCHQNFKRSLQGGGGGKDWEFGVSRCRPAYVAWINIKGLLWSTRSYIQHPGT